MKNDGRDARRSIGFIPYADRSVRATLNILRLRGDELTVFSGVKLALDALWAR
jgi:hypothetical protein